MRWRANEGVQTGDVPNLHTHIYINIYIFIQLCICCMDSYITRATTIHTYKYRFALVRIFINKSCILLKYTFVCMYVCFYMCLGLTSFITTNPFVKLQAHTRWQHLLVWVAAGGRSTFVFFCFFALFLQACAIFCLSSAFRFPFFGSCTCWKMEIRYVALLLS